LNTSAPPQAGLFFGLPARLIELFEGELFFVCEVERHDPMDLRPPRSRVIPERQRMQQSFNIKLAEFLRMELLFVAGELGSLSANL
jgi:hypothetical protein